MCASIGEAGIPGVIYGAGPRTVLESNAKRADERLDLEDLRRATKVIARTLHRFAEIELNQVCGQPKPNHTDFRVCFVRKVRRAGVKCRAIHTTRKPR